MTNDELKHRFQKLLDAMEVGDQYWCPSWTIEEDRNFDTNVIESWIDDIECDRIWDMSSWMKVANDIWRIVNAK
jgi:hypothetical protein